MHLGDRREIGGFAGMEAHPKQRSAGLEQVEKDSAAPVLGRLALAGRTVFDQFGLRLPGFPVSEESAPLMHRV